MKDMFFSRERAAGYEPTVLEKACVLLIGTGALGQNIALNLSMSQIGTLLLIDLDRWELHNATRSVFFPSSSDKKRWGEYKSAIVAQKIKQIVTWSNKPHVLYATRPIQALGDAPFRNATVVISAVDNQAARDYIGFKAARFGIPLVEGGFSGPRMNSTILLNDNPKAPCWHCNISNHKDRNKAIQLSCTQAAKQAEEAGFVPAIQSASAFLAALMSEATIQMLHGNTELGNRQVFMNIRTATSSVAELQFNPKCRCHSSSKTIDFRLALPPDVKCKNILKELKYYLPSPTILLPFSFIVCALCAECKHPIKVNEPEWIMADLLFCKECGGKWDRTNRSVYETCMTLSEDIEPLLDLPLGKVGLVAGSLIEAENGSQDVLFELEGGSDLPFFTQVQESNHAI